MKSELIKEAKRMTWKEYVKNLDLSHWDWRNAYPWSDREVVFISDELIIYPIYPEDILEDVNVSYELLGEGIAISWDNFQEDCTVLTDTPEQPVGYLLIQEVDDYHWSLLVDKVFSDANEIKEFLDNRGDEYYKRIL